MLVSFWDTNQLGVVWNGWVRDSLLPQKISFKTSGCWATWRLSRRSSKDLRRRQQPRMAKGFPNPKAACPPSVTRCICGCSSIRIYCSTTQIVNSRVGRCGHLERRVRDRATQVGGSERGSRHRPETRLNSNRSEVVSPVGTITSCSTLTSSVAPSHR